METTENVKILLRGDTKYNWESVNPVLGKNEIAIEWGNDSPEKRIKIGDGASQYNALPYTVDEYAIKLALESEATARAGADATLQGDLATEATARGEADAALQESIDTAQGTADTAKAKADTAQEAADAAQGSADTAKAKADTAQEAADAAQGSADAAQDTADTALGNAASAAQDAANAQHQADVATDKADTAQGTANAALPRADVVAPDDSAAAGQAADAAVLNTIIAGLVKLASSATQEVFSNLALKTYVDSEGGQTKAFQLLGTAIDGTEHTLIELAEYGAAQQIEIGSETIHLNLNNFGPVGGDNHITCDTHDVTGAAVKLSIAWLTDVVSQCAVTLAGANGYTDDRVEQLRVDALILQDPCKESELPEGPFDPSHNGYFYQITDFDVSYPEGGRKGSAVWYDELENYYLAVDTYKNADEETITENSNGEFMVADVETGTIVADESVFSNSVVMGFLDFVAAVVAKINGLFSLVSGLSTAIGTKYTKPAGGIPTSDMALTQGQGDALDSGITADLVADLEAIAPDLFADDEDTAITLSEANPTALVFYPEAE